MAPDDDICPTCSGAGHGDPPVRRSRERAEDPDEEYGFPCLDCECKYCGRSTGLVLPSNRMCAECALEEIGTTEHEEHKP